MSIEKNESVWIRFTGKNYFFFNCWSRVKEIYGDVLMEVFLLMIKRRIKKSILPRKPKIPGLWLRLLVSLMLRLFLISGLTSQLVLCGNFLIKSTLKATMLGDFNSNLNWQIFLKTLDQSIEEFYSSFSNL